MSGPGHSFAHERAQARLALSALLALLVWGCASVERGRYGVDSLRIAGVEKVDERALKACLVTVDREHFGIKLGVGSPKCNRPPFDGSAPVLRLWRWPWTEWPTFNEAVFNQDLERILRWYRARGFYEARIRRVRHEPKEAAIPGAHGSCDPETDQCTVDILVEVSEGPPVLVTRVNVSVNGAASATLREALQQTIAVMNGERFDEARYDERKRALSELARAHGFASVLVTGTVAVNTAQHSAEINIEVETGPPYRFGKLEVSGQGSLPKTAIASAAQLPTGERYDPDVLKEVQAEVFALGAFSAVEVSEIVDDETHEVNVEVKVTPLVSDQLRVGLGVQSGATRRTDTGELASVPQWDAHVFGNYERRHVLGTLGRLSVEERPRLIFNQPFPGVPDPTYGNVLAFRVNQPGLVEARSNLFLDSAWDFGPDAFLGFRRHDLFGRLGIRRGYLRRAVVATLAVQQDFFLVPSGDNPTSDGSPTPTPYGYSFVEQDLRVDLRDDRVRPNLGAYFGLNASEAPRWAASDWTLFRLIPEARGYLPLPLDMVWATRLAAGAIFIKDASPGLDALSQQLGPTSYRLRGGGANGNRGFLPGRLGAGVQGGLRRWEASTELRLALGRALGLVGFIDFGDVNASPFFRFYRLNTSAGAGLRYHTPIGVLRLDAGFRIPSWQSTDGSVAVDETTDYFPFSHTPGALHFTVGESF